MNVTLEDAYAEACRALGESIVTQRLLAAEVQRLTPPPEQKSGPAPMPTWDQDGPTGKTT